MSLRNESVKLDIIERFDRKKQTVTQIAEELGIAHQTVSDFLRKKTWKEWWDEYDEEEVKSTCHDKSDTELETLCEHPDYSISNLAKRLRTAQRTNNQLRKVNNGLIERDKTVEMIRSAVREAAVLSAPIETQGISELVVDINQPKVTYEILLGDYQLGKLTHNYDSMTAEKAMFRYGLEICRLLENDKRNVERIILALLGDLVEDHLKHGVQSAVATDSSLSQQLAQVIQHLWKYVVKPLAEFGIPMDIHCIAGNHGSSQHKGMDIFKAGRFSYDYVVYETINQMCEVAGFNHVAFSIPEGVFDYTSIYGKYVVYEHGYFNTATEKSMEDQRAKRGNQLQRHVTFFRCGDKHHLVDIDNGRLVTNGAFFGAESKGEEYAGVLGFTSIPCQAVYVHQDTQDTTRNSVVDRYVIQLGGV